MFVKRVLTSFAVVAASVAALVLPSASPVSATAPTVIDIVGTPGAFGTNAAGFCAITQSGSNKELHCWGTNFSGRLGVGDTTGRSFPTKATANPASGFTNTNVTAVAMGAMSVCAIENGSVFCAGTNSSGQLGNGTTNDSSLFVKVADNNAAVPSISNSGFSKIAVGNNSACALKMSMAYCWGADTYGLIGDGAASTAGSNVPIMLADASPFINGAISEIGLSGKHACLLRDMGQANDKKTYCWGMTGASAVGGTATYDSAFRNVATIVPDGGGFTNGNVDSVSVGEESTCVVDAGVVRCFGANNGGISSPAGSAGPIWPPVAIPDAAPFTNSGVAKVVNGATSACAIKTSVLYCWGSDFAGSLGDGGTANADKTAVKVAAANGFTNTNVSKVAISAQTACALEAGSLWCWGNWGWQLAGLVPNGASADVFSPEAAVWPVAPALTSSPATVSPSGGSVTITGSGFTGTSAVTIDSTAATFVVDNAGSITITVPALTAGTYTITITTPGGPITQQLTIGTAPTSAPASSTPASSAPASSVPAVTEPAASAPTTAPASTQPATSAPTTAPASTQPPTTAPASGVSDSQTPTLVTASNQAQLTRLPGQAVVVQNGVEVTASLTNVASSAAVAASTPPAQRSAVQIAEIQAAGAALITSFRASLPQGATSTVSVSNTATGAVVQGLAFDASGRSIDIPIEDVLLITTPTSALLLGGVDATNAAANLTASGVLEIGAGGIINVAGSGLPGAAAAELVIMSTPRLLKSFSAGADGTFADRAALPADLPAGNHTVVLAGSGIYMAVGITVEATLLPTTGSTSTPVVVFALFVLVFGVLFIRSRRTARA
jgi:alpha-tubulin suppressor-like RCC1 family protein